MDENENCFYIRDQDVFIRFKNYSKDQFTFDAFILIILLWY